VYMREHNYECYRIDVGLSLSYFDFFLSITPFSVGVTCNISLHLNDVFILIALSLFELFSSTSHSFVHHLS